jgi:hypothetical protein
MRIFKMILGIFIASLGVLWTLQGADLIWIKPVLCFADCEPLVGGSKAWLAVGVISIAIGVLLLVRQFRSRA